jgi:hypothetical protein
MSLTLRIGTLLAAVVIAASPAFAADGLVITQKTTTSGSSDSQEQRIFVDPTHIRVEGGGSGATQVMVFDGNAQVMRIINTGNKTYMELTKADVDRMAAQMNQMMTQMQEQLKNMPPERRAQIEAMMRGRGMGALMAQASKTEYRRVGTGHVASWDCTKYEGIEDGKKVSELCTVEPSALGFSQADFAVTQQMADFFKSLSLPGMNAQDLVAFLEGGNLGFSGIPVSRTSVGPPERTSELVGVERRNLADSLFAVPDGYSKQAMPMLGR